MHLILVLYSHYTYTFNGRYFQHILLKPFFNTNILKALIGILELLSAEFDLFFLQQIKKSFNYQCIKNIKNKDYIVIILTSVDGNE